MANLMLTSDKIAQVRRLAREGNDANDIARILGATPDSVRSFCKRYAISLPKKRCAHQGTSSLYVKPQELRVLEQELANDDARQNV